MPVLPVPSVAPTAPTAPVASVGSLPPTPPPPLAAPEPVAAPAKSEISAFGNLSDNQLIYAIACYYYSYAFNKGMDAVKRLDTAFIVNNTLANSDLFKDTDDFLKKEEEDRKTSDSEAPVDTIFDGPEGEPVADERFTAIS